jgi:hypothetical protein
MANDKTTTIEIFNCLEKYQIVTYLSLAGKIVF